MGMCTITLAYIFLGVWNKSKCQSIDNVFNTFKGELKLSVAVNGIHLILIDCRNRRKAFLKRNQFKIIVTKQSNSSLFIDIYENVHNTSKLYSLF